MANQDEIASCPDEAKLLSLAELAAGAGHEINNPIATIVGRAQQLLRSESDPERRKTLGVIASQALRIRDMIGDLMLFARPPAAEPGWTDLVEVARATLAPISEESHQATITFSLLSDAPVVAFVDPQQISVALAALVENAITAIEGEGIVSVTVSEPDGTPTITVVDDGCGFTDVELQHAFDPFFSGRQAGRGLGFGLPKAWRIVTLAGGSIDMTSSAQQTTCRVTLPRPENVGTRRAEGPRRPRRRS